MFSYERFPDLELAIDEGLDIDLPKLHQQGYNSTPATKSHKGGVSHKQAMWYEHKSINNLDCNKCICSYFFCIRFRH